MNLKSSILATQLLVIYSIHRDRRGEGNGVGYARKYMLTGNFILSILMYTLGEVYWPVEDTSYEFT